MQKTVLGLASILMIFLATSVIAQQGPQGRWWQTPQIARALKLTPGEIRQLDAAWEDSRARMIKLMNQVETEQARLQTLLEKKSLDEKAVRDQNRKLEAARSRLADERTDFVMRVRKIIGHARFQQFSDMR